MSSILNENNPQIELGEKQHPPGKTKIMAALRLLLEEKDFVSITTAEIAKTAGVTEALIYKYFHDKRDLLHQVLAEYLSYFIARAETDVRGTKGALNQLRKLIYSHISMYAHNRVFARILLLEVRNYPDYFGSDAYRMVKRYTSFLMDLIEKGVEERSIRSDIASTAIRQTILGAIEHACLAGTIFNRAINPEQASDEVCEIILRGITVHD